MVKLLVRAVATAGVVGILSVTGATAAHATDNWGQVVKACNSTPWCYPGDGSRGSYVAVQANDSEGPGYAWEIHAYALPGNSSPSLPSV
ncbi:MAG TPA: hypothetical protein VLS51_03255 [Propionibacteriaceae bacterium]|nr:hypothetical protein [Propionibacteriaceae bacterium]